MQEEDFDREIKVLVVGNGGVGKTSMIRRFCKGIYTDEYKKTIGVDFLEKALYVDALAEEVRFMLWDTGTSGVAVLVAKLAERVVMTRSLFDATAGQEEFDSITRTYYRGAGSAVIAFSTTDRASFEAVAAWKNKIETECGDIAMAIVQNKVDLVDKAVVTPEEVMNLARKLNLKLYRTCVKENINVTEVFVYLSELHHKKLQTGQLNQQPAAPAIQPSREEPTSQSQGEPSEQKQQKQQSTDNKPRTIDLAPSKQRTKGKKSLKDRFTKCSII